MSLSAKEKLQLRSQSKKKIMPTGLYLFHPASNRWIPAQCDDEGRLVIDPSDLDTRYHKKGKDLDMDNFAINELKSVYPKTDQVGYVGRWDTAQRFAQSAIMTMKTGAIIGMSSSTLFKTYTSAAYGIFLQSYDTAMRTCASLKGGMLEIPRVGDMMPYVDAGSKIGASDKRIHTIYPYDVDIGEWGLVKYDDGDQISYDRTNNRFLFSIGGAIKGYVDIDGFHNGAPPGY